VNRERWLLIGMSVFAATGGSEEGYDAFFNRSQKWVFHHSDDDTNTRKLWDSFKSSPPTRVTAGTLFFEYKKAQGFLEAEQQIDKLAALPAIAYERKRKKAAKKLKVRSTVLDAEVKKRRKRKHQPEDTVETVSKEKLEESARHLIECEDVLATFIKTLSKVVVGEEAAAKLLYLATTSRLFDKPNMPMHTVVKGPSAVGKTQLVNHVLEFLPPEQVIAFSALSEKALFFMPGDFVHKILCMGEAGDQEEARFQDRMLRQLMSEGKISYLAPQKVDGELETRMLEKHGPCVTIVTTTKNRLHHENETRMLSVEITDCEAQTRAVMDKVAEVVGYNKTIKGDDLKPWQDYQRWLAAGDCRVIVPFAKTLISLIPPKAVRLRRDSGQLLIACKAHALLHRRHRPCTKGGVVKATISDDYATVRPLLASIVAEGAEVKVRKAVLETSNVVADLQELPRPGQLIDDDNRSGVEVHAIAQRLGLERTAAWRRVKDAEAAGLLVNLEKARGRPGRYRTTGHQVETVEMLPTPEELYAAVSARNRKNRATAGKKC
jgi:hypothetical protein